MLAGVVKRSNEINCENAQSSSGSQHAGFRRSPSGLFEQSIYRRRWLWCWVSFHLRNLQRRPLTRRLMLLRTVSLDDSVDIDRPAIHWTSLTLVRVQRSTISMPFGSSEGL